MGVKKSPSGRGIHQGCNVGTATLIKSKVKVVVTVKSPCAVFVVVVVVLGKTRKKVQLQTSEYRKSYRYPWRSIRAC